jgi:hypothetical protein
MRQRGRWTVVAAVLAGGWLASPGAVPLYDGVGFPDEPYRFVPPRGTAAPTVAEVRLELTGGVNLGGLLANSAEVGPQVTVYAPPQAFGVAGGTTGQIVLRAEAVPLTGSPPPGQVVSNVYALTLTSAAGPVTVRPEAQTPAITLRAVTPGLPLPIVQYRPSPDRPWQPLRTKQVGRDIVNAPAPGGAGEYVLARPAAAAKKDGGGRGPLLLVVGLAVLLVAGVLVGVRLLARQSEE